MIYSSHSTMVLYFLFPALILGIVETANVTDALYPGGLSELEGTQTSNASTSVNGTIKQGNVTSMSYMVEVMKHEGDLEFPSNQTFNVTSEDDENFQDQERDHQYTHCFKDSLVTFSHLLCGANFHKTMTSISPEHWCKLDYIILPYNTVTKCMESLSGQMGCYYPNPEVQDFFLEIHSLYFQNCTEEDLPLPDVPHGLLVILSLIPVSLIPILVFLVVWKSKVRE